RDSLDEILFKFSPIFEDVKGLAEEFRDIIFNSKKKRTGNLDDPNKLYETIIAAFDRAIEALKISQAKQLENPRPTEPGSLKQNSVTNVKNEN
ncbi:hypothetical protein BGT96224_A21489, partial [Blumeria graminis f. sp. tritici 96224]